LGPAKYYIDTPVSENDEHSYWFPTIGDSMTDGTERSIPNRSFVLARWLRLNSVKDVPPNRPIVIIIHYSSEQFCLLKSVAAVHEESTDKEIVCAAITQDAMIFGCRFNTLNLFLW
jgi:hypothetical protein